MLCRQCSTEGLIEMCVSCAQARIADLEKQLAEQTRRAETAEHQVDVVFDKMGLHETGSRETMGAAIAACWLADQKRAEAAEKRVAELQALVDAAIAALRHLGPCPNCRRPWGAHGTGCRIGYLELAAKDPR